MDYRRDADEIQKDMLDQVSDSYEKTKGYFVWDILKAVAIGIKNLLVSLQSVSDKLDIENLSKAELERFIVQRAGISRKAATKAKGFLTVAGQGEVVKGDLFATDGAVKFAAAKTVMVKGSAIVPVEAVEAGPGGNVAAGTVTKMPITIQGIASCTNTEAITEGYEAESDTALRNRYYEKLRLPATSGNVYHYLTWAKEVPGVGDAKIFPLWNGNNTVKVLIVDNNKQPATTELVATVQGYIDPGSTGEGRGKAPIGAFCTVEAAKAKNIDVAAKVILSSGASLEGVKEEIKENLRFYLQSTVFKKNYVSFAQVGAVILEAGGVEDYSELSINGMNQNVAGTDEEIFVLGSVVLT